MVRKTPLILLLVLVLFSMSLIAAGAWDPIPVEDDPLVRIPGTQPNQVALEDLRQCTNCHQGDLVEPVGPWIGSMMAQAARDPLFFAAMTVAGQDSIRFTGTPNAMDLCERCHFPKGWLEGRSDPPNASLMAGDDYDGVQCDFCHRMWDPFFDETATGAREGDLDGNDQIDPEEWVQYWDETDASGTPSTAAAAATYASDATLAQGIQFFNGAPFFENNQPPEDYDENGGGQFFVTSDSSFKRAPFADAESRSHNPGYSRYHKSRYFCGSCHDVSNPVLANLGEDPAEPLPSEVNPAYSYFHIERTFSEFMASAFAAEGGAPGEGPYDPATFQTSYANNYIAKCQDCHLPDVEGRAGTGRKGLYRTGDPATTESVEHPNSGQPFHDMTGGSAWVAWMLASAVPGSPNYDQTNYDLFNQGPAVLTLDMTAGEGLDPDMLLDGVDRSRQQLVQAAAIPLDQVTYGRSSGDLDFRIVNYTGHKLISGYPEGRRMFVNIKAYDAAGELILEINPYDYTAGTLKGLNYPYIDPTPPSLPVVPIPEPLEVNQRYVDELVYEVHPSSSLTGEDESFHMVLADDRYKDNRIPPRGFDLNEAAERLILPRWHGDDAEDYFTAEENAGGYDQVSINIGEGAADVELTLYYQTTSREFVEFLRDEINGTGNLTLPPPSPENDSYIIQTDPFFSQLKAWGDTIWQLWAHNMSVDGAKPFTMTQTIYSVPLAVDLAYFEAKPGRKGIDLTWETVSEIDHLGFNLYRSDGLEGRKVRLNAALIPSPTPGSSGGNTYAWIDRKARSGRDHWYFLETIDITGNGEIVGTTMVAFEQPLYREPLPEPTESQSRAGPVPAGQ
ncbi:MAG: multiheme c-type cytochrome [Chloroflexota bacterium]|nr:multiheme c-type cytochrome [Chloroflexota bacterium]